MFNLAAALILLTAVCMHLHWRELRSKIHAAKQGKPAVKNKHSTKTILFATIFSIVAGLAFSHSESTLALLIIAGVWAIIQWSRLGSAQELFQLLDSRNTKVVKL